MYLLFHLVNPAKIRLPRNFLRECYVPVHQQLLGRHQLPDRRAVAAVLVAPESGARRRQRPHGGHRAARGEQRVVPIILDHFLQAVSSTENKNILKDASFTQGQAVLRRHFR